MKRTPPRLWIVALTVFATAAAIVSPEAFRCISALQAVIAQSNQSASGG